MGEDIDHLAKEIRAVIGGPEEVSQKFRVVVLSANGSLIPGPSLTRRSTRVVGRRLSLVVVPTYPDTLAASLVPGSSVISRRAATPSRFLLPQKGTGDIYYERELLVLARAVYLALQWHKPRRSTPIGKTFQADDCGPSSRPLRPFCHIGVDLLGLLPLQSQIDGPGQHEQFPLVVDIPVPFCGNRNRMVLRPSWR